MRNVAKTAVLIMSLVVLVLTPLGVSQGIEVRSSGCVVLTNNLFWGSRDYFTGGGVTKLQVFLSSQGYLKHEPTGYFGILTWNAVKKFQREHNIIQTGFVGPLTRAEIERVSCSSTPTTKPDIDSMSPTSGPVGTTVTLTGRGFTYDNTIKFGSGVIVHVASYDNGTRLIFNVPEYLNPACYYANPPCMTFAPSQRVTAGSYDARVENSNGESNKKTFKVTDASASVRLDAISPTQGPVGTEVTLTGTGFGNNNTIHLGQGVIYNIPSSNSGTRIKFLIPEYVSPYCRAGMYCIAIVYNVDPGDYDVRVETATSTSNKKTFTVTSGSTSGGPLRITGLDAPNTLRVGQTGTWTVRVESSASQQLSYSVRWGDEALPYASQSSSALNVQNNATFTHVYTYSGVFTPTFTVTNSNGASATMSASAIVTSN